MTVNLPGGSISPLQKQLFFYASRRSMSEMERILERFIVSQLQKLDDDACTRLLALLQQPDPDLLDWITGVVPPPATLDREALGWITRFRSEVSD
ncbi:MAG: succinate dehydrogenase assembly factor 2 [Magnetococcales bacterium]|nr:succinate dehydrogenase assembly factor 2 [Magnetococcales bacterium]